ncbi:DUF4139 domain-containing protein [Algiphilus aromaticivorans]|uniref:DUF4139 domain-containing protein n=1 Tax=Algiphilus aromaticivorans TaxID=382454 RepID=UPI0005C1950E|nr:mucoidy inhibitor MuiA family protein [Algiphilus aromaticivorans]
MLRSILLLLCLSLSTPTAARVTAVHLMPDGAEITRELQLAGELLTVEGLPAGLDIARLRIEPDEGVRIRSVDLRIDPEAAEGASLRERLQGELNDVQDRIARLDREASDREIARGLLQRIGSGDEEQRSLRQTMTEAVDALHRLTGQEIEARATRRELEAERDQLQARLNELGSRARSSQQLHIDAGEGRGTLRLRYPVDAARFEVAYRMTLDTAAGMIALQPRLLIRQSTGEDWDNVRITASTTRRSYRLSVPDPQPRVLRPRPEAKADQFRGAAAAAPQMEMAQRVTAGVQPRAYDIAFELPEPVSIPADNRPRPFALPEVRREATLHARIVPQQEPAAYLVAEWHMPEDAAMAAGRAEILRDGVLVGQTRLPLLMPGQEHEQGFGIDPSLEVDVVREPVKRDESFFGGTQRWVQAQTVTVDSAHRQPVALRMVDAVPVSGDGDISVELAGDPPSERDVEGRKGVHEWRTELAPGASQQWSTQVTISAPAKLDLNF